MNASRWLIVAVWLLTPAVVQAQDDPQARRLAQEILDEGSALFDTRDAVAMAATYTGDARITLFARDDNQDGYKVETREGRTQIEALYRELFGNRTDRTTSKNTVQYARRIGADLLVIHGEFAPDVGQSSAWPFVQVRRKQGDKWLMMSLELFLIQP